MKLAAKPAVKPYVRRDAPLTNLSRNPYNESDDRTR